MVDRQRFFLGSLLHLPCLYHLRVFGKFRCSILLMSNIDDFFCAFLVFYLKYQVASVWYCFPTYQYSWLEQLTYDEDTQHNYKD